jgi:hypothetical protein
MIKRDTQPDMAVRPDSVQRARPVPVQRHIYGPRPVGALVPAIARPAFRKRSPAAAQVMADWASIVGPKLAAVTSPRRLSAGKLVIACTGPVAMELQHLAPELISRINTHLGTAAIERLGFIQAVDAPEPAGAAIRPPLSAADERRAADSVKAVPSGELHDALAALSRAVLAAGQERSRRLAIPSTPPRPKQ